MPVLIKRKDGKIEPFKNADFIPAYYFLPKCIIDKAAAPLRSLPRCPMKLFTDWDAIAIVESDLFLELISDAYAYLVWPYLGINTPCQEVYSGYAPNWSIAHMIPYWIDEMERLGVLCTVKELKSSPIYYDHLGYVPESFINIVLERIVPAAMERHNLTAIIECEKEYRCFEDFDDRKSKEKLDFYRKWYHTRTQHPQISLDNYLTAHAENSKDEEWEPPDLHTDVAGDAVAAVFAEQFMNSLDEKGRRILELRLEGKTLKEIADELGYKNHSGVLKRLRKIGQAYEEYAGVDFGFHGKHIA